MKAAGQELLSLCQATATGINKKIEFICNQLIAHSQGQQGKKYDVHIISEAANLFLRSRNGYNSLRSLLILPHEKTLRSFFGKFSSAGNKNECVQVVHDVFSSLQEQQKFVYISADEIYVKPAVRFRASHVIGFAQNQDSPTPARTVLALMINFLRGTSAFVARLIPVVNLKHAFLVDLLLTLIEIIHQAGWGLCSVW